MQQHYDSLVSQERTTASERCSAIVAAHHILWYPRRSSLHFEDRPYFYVSFRTLLKLGIKCTKARGVPLAVLLLRTTVCCKGDVTQTVICGLLHALCVMYIAAARNKVHVTSRTHLEKVTAAEQANNLIAFTQNVHSHVHKSPPVAPIGSQMNLLSYFQDQFQYHNYIYAKFSKWFLPFPFPDVNSV